MWGVADQGMNGSVHAGVLEAKVTKLLCLKTRRDACQAFGCLQFRCWRQSRVGVQSAGIDRLADGFPSVLVAPVKLHSVSGKEEHRMVGGFDRCGPIAVGINRHGDRLIELLLACRRDAHLMRQSGNQKVIALFVCRDRSLEGGCLPMELKLMDGSRPLSMKVVLYFFRKLFFGGDSRSSLLDLLVFWVTHGANLDVA